MGILWTIVGISAFLAAGDLLLFKKYKKNINLKKIIPVAFVSYMLVLGSIYFAFEGMMYIAGALN